MSKTTIVSFIPENVVLINTGDKLSIANLGAKKTKIGEEIWSLTF